MKACRAALLGGARAGTGLPVSSSSTIVWISGCWTWAGKGSSIDSMPASVSRITGASLKVA